MDLEAQKRAPIYEALERFRKKRVVPFDVPGHKRGRGNPELAALLGEKCVGLDVNSMKPLDNLCHPVSVIREAEELAAEAFGASHAFLMVGGTTSAVQGMILSVCKAGDKIILPFSDLYCINVTNLLFSKVGEQLRVDNKPLILHCRRLQAVFHIFKIICNEGRKEYVA